MPGSVHRLPKGEIFRIIIFFCSCVCVCSVQIFIFRHFRFSYVDICNNKIFLNFFCQYFNSEELMIAHRLIRHSTNSTNSNNSTTSSTGKSGGAASEKTYECDVCMKTFNKHSSWWKHKKCHTGERAYKCYICERAFGQQANLQRVTLTI